MPGMVAFRRRWSVGSDDIVVPAVFLIILHLAWILVLALIRGLVPFDTEEECTKDLCNHILGYIIILGCCILMEACIAFVSTRGSILRPEPRAIMEYLLYIRLILGFLELAWLIVGAVWSAKHYQTCKPETAKKALLGVMICNWIMMLSCIISIWCTYDSAGAKWVKMKKFQDSLKERRRVNRRQSGSRRNWRQRKAFRAYEESWDRRLQLLCCCVERKGRNQNSMSEIAQLFTEFFRDLDVVPSDIVAGLVLLRHHQKQRMKMVIAQGSNDIYQYLSGVAIKPSTQFLQLTKPEVMGDFIKVVHYMRFALAAYGWPVYVMMNPCTWLCRLLPMLSCCSSTNSYTHVVDDNCCGCNFAALKRIGSLHDLDVVYATYHVDIGETPFYVALDHEFGKVVVCVRGTLSLQDVLTDLKAEPETLPLNPLRDDWQGHKGMVQAALYIKKKLIDDRILDMAWERDEEYSSSSDWLKRGKDVAKYDLVCVGHSLGAGTAAILAILLKSEFPTLHCYAFSPPGGLLTLTCVEETKSFITSVVVGKDVVPRIGLPQLEMLRTDIINQIKNCKKSKWNIISKGFCCCGSKLFFDERNLDIERDVTAHPSNSQIGLSAHTPLYPPGNMIHVVRSHVADTKSCQSSEPIYQALWASNADFDEVLVSPTMINDHMPDNVLECLEKVLLRVGPQKPVRTMTESERRSFFPHSSISNSTTPSPSQAQGFLETSFTSDVTLRLQSTGGSERNQLAHSWDRAADQILVLQSAGDNSQVGALVNPEIIAAEGKVRPQFSLTLSSEPVHAPLASPETLSLASGIVGGMSGPNQKESFRDSLRRSLNSPPSHTFHRHSVSSNPSSFTFDSDQNDLQKNITQPSHPSVLSHNQSALLGSPAHIDVLNVSISKGVNCTIPPKCATDLINYDVQQSGDGSPVNYGAQSIGDGNHVNYGAQSIGDGSPVNYGAQCIGDGNHVNYDAQCIGDGNPVIYGAHGDFNSNVNQNKRESSHENSHRSSFKETSEVEANPEPNGTRQLQGPVSKRGDGKFTTVSEALWSEKCNISPERVEVMLTDTKLSSTSENLTSSALRLTQEPLAPDSKLHSNSKILMSRTASQSYFTNDNSNASTFEPKNIDFNEHRNNSASSIPTSTSESISEDYALISVSATSNTIMDSNTSDPLSSDSLSYISPGHTYSKTQLNHPPSTDFACHSPSEAMPGEYEHPNLHYSQAGTGYPHGAYHPPIRFESSTTSLNPEVSHIPHKPLEGVEDSSFSNSSSSSSRLPHPFKHCQSEASIFAKHLPPKLGIKRSAEQTDICHLVDETDVFPQQTDNNSIKRSAEQTDISHLQDEIDVFEVEDTVGELSCSRGRLSALHSTPRSSALSSPNFEQEPSSYTSSTRSSRSDDVFESPCTVDVVQPETDV